MFKSPTVFVLGAGASKEANLPIGSELTKNISSMLDFKFERFSYHPTSGDGDLIDAFRRFIGKEKLSDMELNTYIKAGQSVHLGMSQAASIDNYLFSHKSDEKIQFCGKLAIVKSILNAEKSSLLFKEHQEPIELSRVKDTSYHTLFQIMHEEVPLENVDTIFDNVTFIVFNYDRCLEHFLYYALSQYYRIDFARSAEIIAKLKIIRPYGSVGKLPWQISGPNVAFGSVPRDLEKLVSEIKTFNEQIDDEELKSSIAESIKNCHKLIFLGFAFHRQNMNLLKSENVTTKRVYSTGLELSKADCDSIIRDTSKFVCNRHNTVTIHPPENVTCAKFMSDYKRLFAS